MNFCTLFDKNYLSRGLALYSSLKNQLHDDFNLYILATDDFTYDWFNKNKQDNICVSNLSDIKEVYPILEKLQKERNVAEFNWTLSSFSIQFFLRKYNLEDITYLDADLYFYSSPEVLFQELKEGESVIITPHNYTPEYDQSKTSGRYCVQFMYFKNNEDGNKVLEWWRNACEECCSSVPIDGKFGDQKYLDDWLSRFEGIVHEETNIGCGLAPWNIQQYNILSEKNLIEIENKITKVKEICIFYHYHGVKDYYNKQNNKFWDLNSEYLLDKTSISIFYRNYISILNKIELEHPELIRKRKMPKKSRFLICIFLTLERILKNLIKSLFVIKIFKNIKLKNFFSNSNIVK